MRMKCLFPKNAKTCRGLRFGMSKAHHWWAWKHNTGGHGSRTLVGMDAEHWCGHGILSCFEIVHDAKWQLASAQGHPKIVEGVAGGVKF